MFRLRYFPASLLCSILVLLAACIDVGTRTDADLLYSDYFLVGRTGPWRIEGDEAARGVVNDGHLTIEVDSPQTVHFVTLDDPVFSDFVLEVDAVQLAGPRQSSYGVLFRLQDRLHFYRFDITSNGLYVVEKHDGEAGWQRLSEGWVATGAILQEVNAVNTLKVAADGPVLSFFVNDQLLTQIRDESYAEGKIALDAGTFNQGGLRVSFDNVLVRRR